jgi:hypothetical protein
VFIEKSLDSDQEKPVEVGKRADSTWSSSVFNASLSSTLNLVFVFAPSGNEPMDSVLLCPNGVDTGEISCDFVSKTSLFDGE